MRRRARSLEKDFENAPREWRSKNPSLCAFFLARKLRLHWGAKAGLQNFPSEFAQASEPRDLLLKKKPKADSSSSAKGGLLGMTTYLEL
jgi:hypothetical protein